VHPEHGATPGESWVEVYRSADAALASDRSFMLTAVAIPALMTLDAEGYVVLVDSASATRARVELARYQKENEPPPPAPAPRPLKAGAGASTLVALAVLCVISGLATRHAFRHDWYAAGVLDGAELRSGAWWRAITALTLHADAAHLAGNAGFGAVFGAACAALYGPGRGWLLILSCGLAANLAEGAWMPATMTSLGASTAVFAALGLVTARGRTAAHGRGIGRGLYGALAAGVLLLALLGTGDAHTDVLGHALGFSFGLGAGLALRTRELADRAIDRLCAIAALATVAGAWVVALGAVS